MILRECTKDGHDHLVIVVLGRVPLNWKLSQILCEVRGHIIHIYKALVNTGPRLRWLCWMHRSMLCTHKVHPATVGGALHPHASSQISRASHP